MPSRGLKEIRKSLTDRCNRVLLMYRRHCAPAVQSGQVSRGTTVDVQGQGLIGTVDITRRIQVATPIYVVYAQDKGFERSAFNCIPFEEIGGHKS